jgi:amidophosphoribosyltransferase
MCGITAILYNEEKDGLEIYESLLSIQHRGQDGGGIYNLSDNTIDGIKKKGLISNICSHEDLKSMKSKIYLGHTRYKTNNVHNSFQPFHLRNENFNMIFCHNGNIINTTEIAIIIEQEFDVQLDDSYSDSYLLFNLIFHYINLNFFQKIDSTLIVKLSNFLHDTIIGSFSIVLGIENYGLIVIKDRFGIRPLTYARNEDNDILVSSESCSVNNLPNYKIIRDVKPGETIVFIGNKETFSFQYKNSVLSPCLFEYIYFSRLDSILNKISVYRFRNLLGELMGKTILKEKLKVDFIIPTPETSRVYAYGLSSYTNIPIQECIIKNRYVNRTFIIENKDKIEENIRRKFSVISEIVKDKTAILVDDSIVRGNTSKNIIKLLKDSGIKQIIFFSAAPKIYNTNNYGIYIENKEELITFENKTDHDIANAIGADKIYYNELDDVLSVINYLNPDINDMELSMFVDT